MSARTQNHATRWDDHAEAISATLQAHIDGTVSLPPAVIEALIETRLVCRSTAEDWRAAGRRHDLKQV